MWLRNHPGRIVTEFEIGEIFNGAYNQAATIGNATSGAFGRTGIHPFN